MKNKIILLLLIILAYLSVLPEYTVSSATKVVIEDFSAFKPLFFPEKWKTRDKRGEALYLVQEEGNGNNLFLRADVFSDSVTIYKRLKWDIEKYPYFSWRWRVKQLPPEGNERIQEKNDTAAAVYGSKINLFKLNVNSVKYIWSATLPKGTVFKQKTTWVIVVESGEENLGKWITYKVNLLEDYKKFWGKSPSKLDIVAILSDSNATHSRVIADYDDFFISQQ